MSKSIIQLSLLFTLILIITLTFQKYFYSNKKIINNSVNQEEIIPKYLSNKDIKNNEVIKNETGISVIHNLLYEKFDLLSNTFIIQADKGLISNENSEIVEMKNVTAEIIFQNNEKLFIYSENAILDKENFNSKFYDKVKVSFNNQTLVGNNLVFFFDKNLIILENNIIYKNLDTSMYADKVIIDIKTKETKILSTKVNNKIKIIKKN